VPLHPSKLRERGFNQSVQFAQLINDLYQKETKIAQILVRKKFTLTQTQFSREKRAENVKGAFALAPKIKLDFSKKYILLDDVFTTGNTLNECAKVLKRSGIQSIELLAIGHG
jgi:competence protein ComFC